jgi:hypothetical protein
MEIIDFPGVGLHIFPSFEEQDQLWAIYICDTLIVLVHLDWQYNRKPGIGQVGSNYSKLCS